MPVRSDEYLTEPPADTEAVLQGLTLPGAFAAAVDQAPDAIAITDYRRSLTWRQWRTEVDALARGLQETGVAAGDVVAVQLPNCIEFETLHLAISTVGAVLMPVHMGNGSSDVLGLLARVDPVVVILPARTQADDGPLRAAALSAALPALRTVVVVGEPGEEVPDQPGLLSFDELRTRWLDSTPRPADLRPGMPFVLLPSSGSTSVRPKICLHTHDGLLSNTATVAREGADGPEVVELADGSASSWRAASSASSWWLSASSGEA